MNRIASSLTTTMPSLPMQVATGVLCASYWRGSWYVLDQTLFPDHRLASGTVSLACGATLLGMKQYILSPSWNGTKHLVRMFPPPTSGSLRTRYIQTNRFIMLYGIASACVLIWRGTWLLWDEGAHVVADALAASPYVKYNGKQPQQLPQLQQPQPQQLALPKAPAQLAVSPTHEDHHGESTLTNHEDIDANILFYSGIASHVIATAGLLCMGRFASVMAPPANVSMLKDAFIHARGKSFARASRSFAHSA